MEDDLSNTLSIKIINKTNMEFLELNNEIKEVIEKAEEIAVNNLKNEIEFYPYFVFGNENYKIKKIITDSIEEAIELAIEEIEEIEDETETVVLIYKEKVELKDGLFDAIISQVYNMDEDNGYSYALLYKVESGKIIFLNERIFLGNIRNVLVF